MKQFLVVLIIIFQLLIISECSLNEETIDVTYELPLNKKTVLLWTYIPSFERSVVERFYSYNKNVLISIQYVSECQIEMKFLTSIAVNDNVPDIVTFPSRLKYNFEKKGYLEDLSSQDCSFNENDLIDFPWLNYNMPGLYSVPQSPYMNALIYRRDLTNRILGTDKPEEIINMVDTWAGFARTAETINNSTNGQIHSLSNLEGIWKSMFAQQEEPVFSPNSTGINQAYIDLLHLIRSWSVMGISKNIPSDSIEYRDHYMNGEVVFFVIPTWGITAYLEAYDKNGQGRWDIVALPGKASAYDSNYLGIPTKASNKGLAWKYLDWAYNSSTGNSILAETTKSLPINNQVDQGRLIANSSLLVSTNLMEFWFTELDRLDQRKFTFTEVQFSEFILDHFSYVTDTELPMDDLLDLFIKTVN